MSLIVGVPFVGGMVVAAERGASWSASSHAHDARKLHVVGGRLATVTGTASFGTSAFTVWSLEDTLAELAPARLELAEMDDLARRAAERWQIAREQWMPVARLNVPGQPPATARVVFWLGDAMADFLLGPDERGVMKASEVAMMLLPLERVSLYRPQGAGFLIDHARRAGLLAPSSQRFLLTGSVRDVTSDDARHFAVEAIRGAVRVAPLVRLPVALGGPIDVAVIDRAEGALTMSEVEGPAYTPGRAAKEARAW